MDMTYVSIATVEETLEMVAVAILLYAPFALHRLRVPDAAWRPHVAPEDSAPEAATSVPSPPITRT